MYSVDPGSRLKRAEPHADAEDLLPPALGKPDAQLLLALQDPNRARLGARIGGRRGAAPALAAGAVAVAGGEERDADLEPDSAATAAAGDGQLHGFHRTRPRIAAAAEPDQT